MLSGSEGERALTWGIRLARDLRWMDATGLGPSLGDGAAGLAVLFATLAATTGNPTYADVSERYVSLAADGLPDRLARRAVGLFSGVSGVAWAESVVSRLGGDAPAASQDVDELVCDLLGPDWGGPWELNNGLIGIGVYALERATTSPRLLELVLERLGGARSSGRSWEVGAGPFAADAARRADHDVEIGMAHGLAGLVAFSALAAGSGEALPLLSEATGVLLARHTVPSAPHRAGAPKWCSGDLGVAAALAVARPLLIHPEVPQALAAALGAATPVDTASGVGELGLCHGVAGVAHALQRLAVGNHREQAWDAAAAWGRHLVDRLDAGDRCAGPGFLTGTAGVALALVALATDVPPLWDRALLLS